MKQLARKSAAIAAANEALATKMANICTCTMGMCLGGPDPACATGLAECAYGNVMEGCTSTTLKMAAGMGGGDLCTIDGCPVEPLADMCNNCPWLNTQDMCYDADMPEAFAEAYSGLCDMIGAPVFPHTYYTVRGGAGECDKKRELTEEVDARQLADEWSAIVAKPREHKAVLTKEALAKLQ